jgi:hypothetical protein
MPHRISPANRERQTIMRLMRDFAGLSLGEIGSKFGGLSRERVRQIIGNTGNIPLSSRTDKVERIRSSDYIQTNHDVADTLGISVSTVGKYRVGLPKRIANDKSAGRIGQVWEEWAVGILSDMGMKCEVMPPKNSGYDLIVNGWRVDVKACLTPKKSPSIMDKVINPAYRFGVNKPIGEARGDFYLFIIADTKEVFVVPHDVVPPGTEQVVFCWPTARPSIGKYQKFHNRFDLLEIDNQ